MRSRLGSSSNKPEIPQEQDAVFELLRRRTAVVHDPNREDDTKVKLQVARTTRGPNRRTVDKYLYYRDRD